MKKIVALLILTIGTGTGWAQPIVDIGLFPSVENDTVLEVRLCPSQDFDGVVDLLTFTIRWLPDTTAQMGARINACASGVPISTALCDTVDGYATKIFNAFGDYTLSDAECPWTGCAGNVVMRLPLGAGFNLFNAELVQENYAISLNGQNATGHVYSEPCISTGLTEIAAEGRGGLRFFPNPASETITLALPAGTPRPTVLNVWSADGRLVRLSAGRNGTFDVRSLEPGLYSVRLADSTARFLKL